MAHQHSLQLFVAHSLLHPGTEEWAWCCSCQCTECLNAGTYSHNWALHWFEPPPRCKISAYEAPSFSGHNSLNDM
eukprot:806045-Pelagomonas_calceolata.AAC.1